MCGVGGYWGCSHAVTEAGLWRLAVAWCCCVAVAVGLLRRDGHVGPRCEHELGRACNTNVTVRGADLTTAEDGITAAVGPAFYRKRWAETQWPAPPVSSGTRRLRVCPPVGNIRTVTCQTSGTQGPVGL